MPRSKYSGQGCKSMLGTTEEYNARLERKWKREQAAGASTNKSARGQQIQDITSKDWLHQAQITALMRDIDAMNAQEGYSSDPWTLDHIRPICQGGLHRIENLRPLRLSKNMAEHTRTEQEIDTITKLWYTLRNPKPPELEVFLDAPLEPAIKLHKGA